MTAEALADSVESGDPHELRALLVRLLLETGPGQARLEQLLDALEKSAQLSPSGPGDNAVSELAALRAELASVRQGIERSVPLEELLARSDAQLATSLAQAEKRTEAQLATLGNQISALSERVKQLEAQLRTLAARG